MPMKSKVSSMRRLILASGLIALLLTLSGWTFPSAQKGPGMAFVRIIHASPDVGIVDVFVDGNKLLSSFQFATVTEYVPLPAGSHKVQIALLGKGVHAAVLAQTLQMQANSISTVAVLGTKESGFSFALFSDDNTVTGNAAKIRVYHLSPGTGFVTIAEDQQTLIQGLSYPQVSNYVSLPTGQHTFNLNAVSQHANEAFTATLNPWMVTSVFALGQLQHGSQKFQFVTTQVQGTPQMPSTGSDPVPQASPLSTIPISDMWLAGLFLATVLGGGAGLYALKNRRRRQFYQTELKHYPGTGSDFSLLD